MNELGVDAVARDKSGISSIHAATQGGHYNTIKVRGFVWTNSLLIYSLLASVQFLSNFYWDFIVIEFVSTK